MTSLADVFTDQESTNWLKAWLAVDITKAGLERFVYEEIQTVHSQIFNYIRSKLNLPATASCPTPGKCKTRSNKQPRHCPIKLCDEVHDEIIQYHRYGKPSWKNTSADQWASNPWQIAKCFMPPDGYTDINTVQDTDFNGVISVLLNCIHFDNKVSFSIQPSGSKVLCFLTKAREIGKALRHSSKCKITINDLHDIFTTLKTLLSDPKCLAQDSEAQTAIKKLTELQNDRLKIADRDLCVLFKAANEVLKTAQEVSERAREDIEIYIKRLKNKAENQVKEKGYNQRKQSEIYLAGVFSDHERNNWLKALVAQQITKDGLHQFVKRNIQDLHRNIYKEVHLKLNFQEAIECRDCYTANLLECPTHNTCEISRKCYCFKSKCQSMHNTIYKQPRTCPKKICDKVRDLIIQKHRFGNASWMNTLAELWSCDDWQVAKCFLPAEGYREISYFQDVDYNGLIHIMLTCRQFDDTMSFNISPQQPSSPCILTMACAIGKDVLHSPNCKVKDIDFQEYLTTLTALLCDPKCLAQEFAALEAAKKLKLLQNDKLSFSAADMNLLMQYVRNGVNSNKQLHSSYMKGILKELDEYEQNIKYLQDVKEFTRLLKKHYNTTLLYDVIDSSDMESQIKSIKQIYASQKLHRIHNFERAAQVFKYKDMFYTDGQFNSRIFLKGEAGTGKSTFAVKLVLDWCSDSITYQETSENEIDIQVDHKVDQAVPNTISNGKNLQDPTENIIYDRQRQTDLMFDDTETLMNFQCVFLIRLRDFDDEKEIVNMIKQQIIDKMYADQDREVACTLLHEIMGKEDCLIIQDGLDEWTNRDGKDALPSIVTFHNQCTVLTTTRPWKMTDERIKNIDSTLELDGLNEPYALSSIIIERRFKTESFVRKADFVKYIENNDSLKDLLPSPMLLKLIVNMWMDGIMLSGSLCEIYSILLDNLLKKVTTSKGYFHSPPVFCFERTKHIKPNIACFNAISKLAFSMLFSFERKSSIVFSDRELSEYLLDDQKLFALNAGILSERKGNTLSNLCTSSFVHKSVQEFLAAYHITMNAGVIDEQVRKYIEQFSNTDFKQLYVFLMGMNGEQSAKLRKLIEATIGKDDASLKNDLGCATTGAFRSQSSDAASAKELQFQSLIMAGNKEAEAVKRMATDKHDPSRLVHSEYTPNQPIRVQERKTYAAFKRDISGICEIASGELLITYWWNREVKLLDSTYKEVNHLDLPHNPMCMCSIDSNTVAIVVGYNQVYFIKLIYGNLIQDRTLKLQHKCHGIAHRQGTMYITSGTALYMYTVGGEMASKIKLYKHRATSCAVSPDGDRIYLVDDEGHQLITMSRDGTVISTLSGPMRLYGQVYLTSLHVTDLGQVLVCGDRSATIFQVDKDGRQILGEVVRERRPISVCFSTRTSKLIVGMYYDNRLIDDNRLIEYTIQ